MNHEGLLEVNAKDLKTGKHLETIIDANPDQLDNDDVNNDTDLDPIEAERYKKQDYDLVYELESLDDYLEELSETYRTHRYSKYILEKIFETKEWLFQNRRVVSIDECKNIRSAIQKFLKNLQEMS
jgi:molecular chaperone DnaK (HSP70)